MGEHTREVLSELLELDTTQLDELVEQQILWEERPEVELG